MNLPHLYTSQGLGQLKFLLGHLRAQDRTCRLILISHGYLQLSFGITTNFLNVAYKDYYYWASPSWLTSLWHLISRLYFSIHIKKVWLPLTPHDNDVNLMEYFISQQFHPKQLVCLNRCNLYLQVLSVSNQVAADGVTIISPTLSGHQLTDRRSTLTWPAQGRPPQSDWLLWASAIGSLCSGTRILRPIDMEHCITHQKWFWFIDRGLNIYHSLDNI
jgi:hypothetical protein